MTTWNIHADAVGPAGTVTDEHLEVMLEELAPLAGTVIGTTTGDRFGASFSLELPDTEPGPVRAAIVAEQLFRAAAEHAGLPDWPLVRLEALTDEELDADNARPTIPALVGLAEVAAILKRSRTRASQITATAAFPRPVAVLRSGPVWTRAAVEAFARNWHPTAGRPRKTPPPARSIVKRTPAKPRPRGTARATRSSTTSS